MKQFVLLLITILTFSFTLTTPVAAEGWDPYDAQYQESIDGALQDGSINSPGIIVNHTQTQLAQGVCMLVGGFSCSRQFASNYSSFGLIPQVEKMNMAMMINPPADFGLWLAYTGESLGFLPKQAYAQGFGFNGLRPILKMWVAFSNIAYVIFAFVLVIIGFMVMFRRRIDPKTVVTVQQALPRVIMSLILVAFSYAIAALMIEVTQILIALAYGLFSTAGILPPTREASTIISLIPSAPYDTQKVFTEGTLWEAIGIIFPKGLADFGTLVERILGINLSLIGAGIGAVIGGASAGAVMSFLPGIGTLLGGLIGAGAGAAGGAAVVPLLVQLLVALFIAILALRIFFLFLGAYVQVLLRIIIAPLQIMIGAIPGMDGFGSWFRNLAGQLSVFVVSGIMFMLATAFMIAGEASNPDAVWRPPYFPGSGTSESVFALVGLGILMLVPNIANQTRQTIIGQGGVQAPLGAIAGGVAPAFGTVMQLFTFWQHHQQTKLLRQRTNPGAPSDEKHD